MRNQNKPKLSKTQRLRFLKEKYVEQLLDPSLERRRFDALNQLSVLESDEPSKAELERRLLDETNRNIERFERAQYIEAVTPQVEVSATVGTESFSHSGDYRSVTIHGENFTLTPQQARMVRILHQAWESKRPNVSNESIVSKLLNERTCGNASIEHWRDTWRSNLPAKKALIKWGSRPGASRGTIALNIDR